MMDDVTVTIAQGDEVLYHTELNTIDDLKWFKAMLEFMIEWAEESDGQET